MRSGHFGYGHDLKGYMHTGKCEVCSGASYYVIHFDDGREPEYAELCQYCLAKYFERFGQLSTAIIGTV